VSVLVARASGLLAPFEVPELTIERAIERNWAMRGDGRLLEPKPKREEYLFTFPGPRFELPWGFAPSRIPWHEPYDFGSPFMGLPLI
jgi:hypothetical protein